MTVTYENTFEDAVAWTDAHYRLTDVGRKAIKQWRIGIVAQFTWTTGAVIAGNLITSGTMGMPWWLAAGMFLASFGIGILLQSRLYPRFVQRQALETQKTGRFDQFLGRLEASAAPEGFRVTSASSESLTKWAAIRRVEIGGTHIQVFLTDATFQSIPKRAFRSEEEAQAFVALIERYREAAPTAAAVAALAAQAPGAPWWRSRQSVDTEEEARPVTRRG